MEAIQGAGVCVHTRGSSSSSWLQPWESPCTTQTRPREGPGAVPAQQNSGTASGIPAHGIIPNPLLPVCVCQGRGEHSHLMQSESIWK